MSWLHPLTNARFFLILRVRNIEVRYLGRQDLEDKSRRVLGREIASLRPWKEKYQQEWARVQAGVGWGRVGVARGGKVSRVC